jgi:protein-tyrosine-phosphatase
MENQTYNVLFLCRGNTARSIMAEAILNSTAGGRFKGYSGGSHPSGAVEPMALELLIRMKHDVAGLRSKSWTEFTRPDAPQFHFVFTVCDRTAQEQCPNWHGQPISAYWPVPDPVAVDGDPTLKALAVADAYRMLNNRIAVFTALPIEELDRIALKRKVDQIGAQATADMEDEVREGT